MKISAWLCTLAIIALPAAAQDANGRYMAVPNGSAVGIWIVDTQTGEAKLCFASGSSGNYTAHCTDPTK